MTTTPPGAPDGPTAPAADATAPPPRPVTPVAIATALLDGVVARLDDGARDDGVLDEAARRDLRRAAALVGGLDPYLARCTTPESPDLARVAGRTHAQDWDRIGRRGVTGALEQEMLSGHVEGQLVKLLVRISGARRTLDVGTFTGYSALAMAEALPDDGTVVTCELDPDAAALAQASFDEAAAGGRIELRTGPALRTLHALADAGDRFDLAFLDADKAGYVDHLAVLLDRDLLRPGALLVADNTLLQGEAYLEDGRGEAGAAIAAFNRRVADDPRLEQVLLPVRDGVTLAVRVDAP